MSQGENKHNLVGKPEKQYIRKPFNYDSVKRRMMSPNRKLLRIRSGGFYLRIDLRDELGSKPTLTRLVPARRLNQFKLRRRSPPDRSQPVPSPASARAFTASQVCPGSSPDSTNFNRASNS